MRWELLSHGLFVTLALGLMGTGLYAQRRADEEDNGGPVLPLLPVLAKSSTVPHDVMIPSTTLLDFGS